MADRSYLDWPFLEDAHRELATLAGGRAGSAPTALLPMTMSMEIAAPS